MADEKNIKENQNTNSKKLVNPSEIKGKIDVPDTRERRDGPGGN